MLARGSFLGGLALLLVAGSVQADVVAIKRSAGLSVTTGLDSRFVNAITGSTIVVQTDASTGKHMVSDTDLWSSTTYTDAGYRNTGANTKARTGSNSLFPELYKFDLSQLPNFLGGRINKAQLRLYYGGGNSGYSVGYITSTDWSEGNKGDATNGAGNFPGAAPAARGATLAHPNAINSAANRNGEDGTTPPLQGWGLNHDSWFTEAGDGSPWLKCTATYAAYSANLPDGSNPSFDGFAVMDVTQIVQLWADGTPDYGFYAATYGNNRDFNFSETTIGPDFQPILFIDYSQHGNPTPVTDLAATTADWFQINLTWTAPSANPPGPVASYDIRYSTSPITDDASFDAAWHCDCTVPTPAAPGTPEHFAINNLSANTTYYFAIKSVDAVGTVSALSNAPVSATTGLMDVTPPAQISDLAAPTVKPNYVVLTWTAVGDDGMTGMASGYDLRYSTTPINSDTDFANATAIGVLAAPKTPGSPETFTMHGLTPSTTYYFAIRARDEAPNWSMLSSVVVITTLAADTSPPNPVTDLTVSAAQINTIYLTWTAPADVGTAGLAGYDVRYSTSPIDENSWASATQVTNEPVPLDPGSVQNCLVPGLLPSTTYYFAIKSLDYAEPANVSATSNIASGTTMPPIAPVVVHNPWLVNDRVADTHNINTIAATYVNEYTPNGVIVSTTNEQKAISIYNNQKRRLYHWADTPPTLGGNSLSDPAYNQNVFGWCLCGDHAGQACTIVKAAGMTPHRMNITNPYGHWMYQVEYDGAVHAFDTMTTMYVYDKSSPPKIASCAQLGSDPSLLLNAVADGRACPGLLLCGDNINSYITAMHNASDMGAFSQPSLWNGNMDLRLGQVFKRTCESWLNEYPTPRSNADSAPGNDPPYHHEASKDYKDTFNFPYWEPYSLTPAQTATLNIPIVSYRRWANGTDTLAPDFRSAGYQAMLDGSSHDIATYNDDTLTPDLHAKTVGTQGEAVFKINVPFYLTDASFSGTFVKTNSSDVCNVLVSTNGTTWTSAWSLGTTGTTTVTNQSLRGYVFNAWTTWYIKVQLKATNAKTDVGVSNFVVTTIFEHNKGAMAYLDKGVNHISLTFDNAPELQASRNVVHVVYHWKEYDGTDWTIDKQYDGYFAASPSNFTITTGGIKVPKTEYITMEVIPPPFDPVPPGQVTDLAAGTASSATVPLTWSATGDDGNTGTAMAYDLRYSTSPITDGVSFEAATPVIGVPSPSPAGTTESFRACYLPSNTTLYFAMKVMDKGGNYSPLSNVITVTTTPAQRVSDLAAGAATSAKVPLTWTAIDDGVTGQYASYDLRYSTSPIIDQASFEASSQAAGLPLPKMVGQPESFTVTYLDGSTTYYFAIEAVDAGGNHSPLSNVVTATTAPAASINDLAAGAVGANKASLTWTAIDDGVVGQYASYDLRYSTAALTDDASFSAATAVTGLPAPKPAGSSESILVNGLSSSTTYFFAIKAKDASGRFSPLSNIIMITTTEADTTAPRWIGDLKARPSMTTGGVDLTWTAPADFGPNNSGPFTCTSYQLRYSTSPILYNDEDVTWNAATAVTGLPVPKAPGSVESLTVSGLSAGTTCYFAIKAADDATPANVSQVSNCAAGVPTAIGSITLQVGLNSYTGQVDTYYVGSSTSGNNSGSDHMQICGYQDLGLGAVMRGILKFDLSAIPAGSNITSATLSLYSYNTGNTKGSSGAYGLYPVTRSWIDSQVNWVAAATGSNWTTAGGDFGTDLSSTAAKQAPTAVPTWYTWDVTDCVRSWVTGTTINYGWILKCTDEYVHNQDYFYSQNAGNTSLRPKMVISDLPVRKMADIDGDGAVNLADLKILVASWNKTPAVRGFEPWADIDGDGTVNLADLKLLIAHWNT